MTNVPIYLVVGSPAECIDYYQVEYKLTTAAGYTLGENQTDIPITLYQLEDNADYDVKITPFCCNGQYGTPLIFVVSTTASDVPTTFTATPGDGEITLTWDNMPDADNYVIDRALDASFGTGLVEVYNGAHGVVVDSGLANGTQYFYRIKSQASGDPDSGYAYDDATPAL